MMTLGQFSVAVGADSIWIHNARAVLGLPPRYNERTARRLALARLIHEAAGVPLDSTFAEQKKILVRCVQLFYGCANGSEARRFDRMLIEAGLIKGF